MKSRKSRWGIVGAVALESIWMIELAVDLYTGQMPYTELLCGLAFCATAAAFLFSIIKSKKRNSRENSK